MVAGVAVVNWSRELIGRAGYYIHLAVSPETKTKCWCRTARSSNPLTAGDVPQRQLGRRQPRHLVGPEGRRSIRRSPTMPG
jgi:hypothetical protein